MIALPEDRDFWDTIEFFQPWEFQCQCGESGCDLHGMDRAFLRVLNEFREYCDFPFTINSGYRCPMHPIELKKRYPGPHQTGTAADIGAYGPQLVQIIYNLGTFSEIWKGGTKRGVPFHGVGLNQKGPYKSRFIHLDRAPVQPYRSRPWPWTY